MIELSTLERSDEPSAREDVIRRNAAWPSDIARELAELRGRLRAAEAVLEHLRCALFVLDAAGVVAFANAPARRLIAEGDGLMLIGRRLVAAVNGDAGRLRELIASVASGGRPSMRRSACAMAVRRGHGRPALCAVLRAARVEPAARSRAVLLYAVDPADAVQLPIVLLRDALGLTEREIEVALATARLGSAPAAAAELNIAPATARSHLQHVFDKTGVRNQVALAQRLALLSVLPGDVTEAPVMSKQAREYPTVSFDRRRRLHEDTPTLPAS